MYKINFKSIGFSKKITKVLQIAALCSILFFLSSCIFWLAGCDNIENLKNNILSRISGDTEAEAAVEVVRSFFDKIIEMDIDSAYGFVLESEDNEYTIEDFRDEFKNVTQIIKIDIKWIEVKNNVAVVGIDMIDTYDDEEKIYKDIEVSLVKDEKGKWKINFWP